MKNSPGNNFQDNSCIYHLEGEFTIAQFSKILDILKKLPEKSIVDYKEAKIDTGIRVILDNFNERHVAACKDLDNNDAFMVESNNQQDYEANLCKQAKKSLLDNFNERHVAACKDLDNNDAFMVESNNQQDYEANLLKQAKKSLLDKLLNRPNKLHDRDIEKGFFYYIWQFISSIFVYTFTIIKFVSILGRKPKHEFQRQIVIMDTINSCYNMGLQAVPIILFLSCAWGVIAALQSSVQLRVFGAEFYAVDLVIILFFKAMGLLISIVVLAARSGSSMIAKIGIMRISDEWNTLKILGIEPEIFLLKPKIIAFIVLMPFLGYISALAGILGGYLLLHSTIHIGSAFLLEALSRSLTFNLFISLLWKGPIFGLIIGLICAYEAKSVSVNSESIVLAITKGVVYSIFACVLVDMFINIISALLGII